MAATARIPSTIDDYLAFGQILLDKGSTGASASCPGVRLFPGSSRGWGFGVAVEASGRYGWDGGYGTSWASDPREEMIGILMTRKMWTSPSPPPVTLAFWTLAYQSIDD